MSLAAWQSALVELVSHGRRPEGPDAAALDAGELAWFDRAAGHLGTEVTRDVCRSWRWQRVAASTPLTLLALRREGLLREARDSYLDDTFAPSTWATSEGSLFLEHLSGRMSVAGGSTPGVVTHVPTFIALERAVLAVRASTWTTNIRANRPDDLLRPGAGGLVQAGCDVRSLLRGALGGTGLPPPGSGHGAFLVAPGIPGCFREATPGEVRALMLVGEGCPVTQIAGLWPNDLVDEHTLTRLEAVGALVREPPATAPRERARVLLGSPA